MTDMETTAMGVPLEVSLDENSIRFASETAPAPPIVDKWNDYRTNWRPGDADRALILLQALEEGLATRDGDFAITITHENLYRMDSDDVDRLALGEPLPFRISVRAHGAVADSDFQYRYQALDDRNVPVEGIAVFGAFATRGSDRWLLTREVFFLLRLIRASQSRIEPTSLSERMLELGQLKALAEAGGAMLDSYLANESIIPAEALGIRLRSEPDASLTVLPVVPQLEDQPQFERRYESGLRIPDYYSLSDPAGRRTRVVPSSEARAALAELRPLRHLSGDRKRQFLDAPTVFLSSSAIRLEDFSDRVREIGAQAYRFYPYLQIEKSKWLPEEYGIRIEADGAECEPSNIPLDPAAIGEMRRAYDGAARSGAASFEFGGRRFQIDSATEERIAALESVPGACSKNLGSTGPRRDAFKSLRQVLLIYENVEEQEYRLSGTEAEPLAIDAEPQLPVSLKPGVTLLRHQRHGLAWLQSLVATGRPAGALLADDMGLGKTLLLWSFLEWLRTERRQRGPVLIVAPVGLLSNWSSEFARFFSAECGLSMRDLVILHGVGLRNFRVDKGSSEIDGQPSRKLDIARLQTEQVVLTSYEVVRDFQFSMGAVDWSVVILDEAQKVKNPTALATKAVKALKAGFRVASTGTPVENSLADLWCILDFANPGLLGCLKDFMNHYQPRRPEEYEALAGRIRERAGPYFLRRRKSDILTDLPQRFEHHPEIMLTPSQEAAYVAAVTEYRASPPSQGNMLRTLQVLRAISCCAVDPGSIAELASPEDAARHSCKLAWLIELVGEIQLMREKAIIFVELKTIQRLLARVLGAITGRSIDIVNGDVAATAQTGGSERMRILERFEGVDGFNLIILSPVATGVGLTITEANHVIHFLRHWNPAREEQATDRAYRIGQRREVHVYYPIATSPRFPTFDMRLNDLLERKRQLSRNALFPTLYGGVAPEDLSSVIQECRPDADPEEHSQPYVERQPDEAPQTCDLDLFPLAWRTFVERVGPSIHVEAGDDVTSEGAVIGRYIAVLSVNGNRLYIVDRADPSANRVREVVRAGGARCVALSPQEALLQAESIEKGLLE